MGKNPENILLASQSFGYGPATELRNIGIGLQMHGGMENSNLYLWNTSEVRAVCNSAIRNVTLLDNRDDENLLQFMERSKSCPQFDAIVSSYDSQSVFCGWFKGIPCYLYDGMLSFWNTGKSAEEFNPDLERLSEVRDSGDSDKLTQIYNEICKNNHHDAVLLAYFLSDFNFARRSDRDQKVLAALNGLGEKTMLVGAIVPPDISYDDSLERNHVLVSLSASIVPTVGIEENLRYVENVAGLVSGYAVEMPDIPWIIAINPILFDSLSKSEVISALPKNVELRPSLNYEDNQRHIARAKALLISPGYSSLHEAANFRTPVMFLPEQNGGQPVGFNKVKKAGYPVGCNLTLAENFNYNLENDFDSFPMDQMYKDSESVMLSSDFSKLRTRFKKQLKRVIADNSYAGDLAHCQYEVIDKLLGGFNGTGTIAAKIKTFFDKPGGAH